VPVPFGGFCEIGPLMLHAVGSCLFVHVPFRFCVFPLFFFPFELLLSKSPCSNLPAARFEQNSKPAKRRGSLGRAQTQATNFWRFVFVFSQLIFHRNKQKNLVGVVWSQEAFKATSCVVLGASPPPRKKKRTTKIRVPQVWG
jgi:hypothetical protein